MICVICKNEIDKQYNADGVMYWDQGHIAEPLATGRCCTNCNNEIVTPQRITDMQMTIVGNLYEDK